MEEFRRLNAIFIEFYTPNVMHSVIIFETGTAARNRNDLLDFDKIERYFFSVGGISTFKRYFHWMLHAECSARHFLVRIRRSSTQAVTIYSI